MVRSKSILEAKYNINIYNIKLITIKIVGAIYNLLLSATFINNRLARIINIIILFHFMYNSFGIYEFHNKIITTVLILIR